MTVFIIILWSKTCRKESGERKRRGKTGAPAVIRVKGTPRTVVIRKVGQHVPDVGRLLALTHNVPTAGTTRTCLSICKEQRERGR